METIKQILERVEKTIPKPFITDKFGNNWREYANETIPKEQAVEIAWKQGRKAILLEKEIESLLLQIKSVTNK